MSRSVRESQPSTCSLPLPGDIIGGRYRAEGMLGMGGMGAVLAAVEIASGQRVAVKLMLPEVLDKPGYRARFLRECRVAAALTSPHAIRVLDAGVDGAPFLVMELLAGQDLKRVLRADGPLPIHDAVGYILQACDAIAEAHGLGVIHRDLKPSNLFLCRHPDGTSTIKVLDFGVSKATKLEGVGEPQSITAADTPLGSPRYMAPEQLRDAKRADARADLWSLGVVLHQLLTGRFPFEARSVGEHLIRLAHASPTPLRASRPEAPAALEAAVLRCLEKRVDRRFQSVVGLARALAPFAAPGTLSGLPRLAAELARAGAARQTRRTSPPPSPVARQSPQLGPPVSQGPLWSTETPFSAATQALP